MVVCNFFDIYMFILSRTARWCQYLINSAFLSFFWGCQKSALIPMLKTPSSSISFNSWLRCYRINKQLFLYMHSENVVENRYKCHQIVVWNTWCSEQMQWHVSEVSHWWEPVVYNMPTLLGHCDIPLWRRVLVLCQSAKLNSCPIHTARHTRQDGRVRWCE